MEPSATPVTLYRLLAGLALALIWPAAQAVLARNGRRVNSLAGFFTFYVAGNMTGPLVGGLMVDSGADYRMIFQVSCVILGAAAISAAARGGASAGHGSLISLGMFSQFIRYPVVLLVILYLSMSYGSIHAVYPALMNDAGITDTDIFLLFFLFGVGRISSLACSPFLSRRSDLTIIGTVLALAAGLAVSYALTSIVAFAITMMLFGFAFGVFFPLIVNLMLSRADKDNPGPLIGSYESIYGVGWVAGPLIAGYLVDGYGAWAFYAVLGVAGMLVGAISIIRRKSLIARM